MTESESAASTAVSRRRFVEVCIGGMGVASAGAVGYPIVAFLGRPQNVEGSQTIRVPVADLSEDQAHYVDWQGQQIVVLFTGRKPKVFSAACTHLGCIIAWDNVKHRFQCPCHGAVFDDEGRVVSGPVSRSLTEVPFKIENDQVVIG